MHQYLHEYSAGTGGGFLGDFDNPQYFPTYATGVQQMSIEFRHVSQFVSLVPVDSFEFGFEYALETQLVHFEYCAEPLS